MRPSSDEVVGLMQRPNDEGFPPVRSLFTALPPAGERGVFGHSRRQVSHFPSAVNSTRERDRDRDAEYNFGPSRRSRRNSLFRPSPYPDAPTSPSTASPSGGVMLRSLNLARHALSAVPSLFKKVVSSSQEPPPAESVRFDCSSSDQLQFSSASHRERETSPAREEFRLAQDPIMSPPLSSTLLRRPPHTQTESPIQQKLCSPPPSRQMSPPPAPRERERERNHIDRMQTFSRETSARGQSKPITTSRKNVITVLKSIEKEYKDHLTLADFRTFQNRRRGILGNELKRLIKAQELAVTSRCIDYEQSERANAADEADSRAFNETSPLEGLPPVLDLGSESEADEDQSVTNEPPSQEPVLLETPPQLPPAPPAEEKKLRRIEAPPTVIAPPSKPSIPEPSPAPPSEPPVSVTPPAVSVSPPVPVVVPTPTPLFSSAVDSHAVAPKPVVSEESSVIASEKSGLPAVTSESITKDILTPTPLFGTSLTSQPKDSPPAVSAPQSNSLFSSSLFGTSQASVSQSASIFGSLTSKPPSEDPKGKNDPPAESTAQASESDKSKEVPKSLFGTIESTPQMSLFGGAATTTSSDPKPATFGSSVPTSLFDAGTPKPSSNTATSTAFPMVSSSTNDPKTSPFGTVTFPTAPSQPSLFGNASSTANTSTSLFGDQSKPTTSIFGSRTSGPEATSPAALFGTPAATAKPTDNSSSLFGGQQSVVSPPQASSLFGQSATTNTPLFGAASTDRPSPTGSLFGSAVSHVPTTATAGASLFGQPSPPSLFGQQQQQPTQSQSLFGANLPSSPFASVSQNTLSPSMPQAAPMFGTTSPSPTGAFGATSSMFATGTPQPSFNQSPFANSQPQADSQENPFTQAGAGVRYRIRRKRNA